jgi:alanine dehydrogenase
MPGAVGRTSTVALCNATLPYSLKLAAKGYEKSAAEDPGFGEGVNLVGGRVTNQAVAESFQMKWTPLKA